MSNPPETEKMVQYAFLQNRGYNAEDSLELDPSTIAAGMGLCIPYKPLIVNKESKEDSKIELPKIEWLIERSKVINCNIHGRFGISNLARIILDHRLTNKLSKQSQLAFCQDVYPTATHTRKAHSLGTYYLSKKMIKKIRENSSNDELMPCLLAVSKRFNIDAAAMTDFMCEIIACCGLAHDLGHGPFSHQFDYVIESYGLTDNEKYPNIEHEYRSGTILENILTNIISPGWIAFMRSIIMADGEGFLYQIVSNEVNGIDCDKFDYLKRDSVNLGVPISFDSRRLLMDTAVVDGDVCYPYQEREQLCDMFESRAKLFNKAYSHPCTIALNCMMTDAMKFLPIDELIESIKTGNMDVFCKYTDQRIVIRMEDDISTAGHIWRRIIERKLYHSIGEIRTRISPKDGIKNEDLDAEVNKRTSALMDIWKGIYPDNNNEFTIMKNKIGYLSGKRSNPLDILPLYEVVNGKKCRRKVTRDEITTLMPSHHQEYQILLIWKGIGNKLQYVDKFKTLKLALEWS
jgi:HD superfamily phosphohydrolase